MPSFNLMLYYMHGHLLPSGTSRFVAREHSTLTGHLISPSSSGNGKYSGKRRTIIIISLYVTISIDLHKHIFFKLRYEAV